MGTVLELDSPRSYMIEPPFHISRSGEAIATPSEGNQLLYKWLTGTWTLMPINMMSQFVDKAYWESAKFRLADMIYSDGWWGEHHTHEDHNELKWDFYQHAQVPSQDVAVGGFDLLQHLSSIAIGFVTSVPPLNLQETPGVNALASREVMPANQGYVVKFTTPERDASRADILRFVFGDYMLRLSADGYGELLNTLDRQSWSTVRNFQWSDHYRTWGEETHEFVIFPHAGRKIEIHFSNRSAPVSFPRATLHPPSRYNYVFDLNYEPPRDDHGTPIITQPGQWVVLINRNYRPVIQVSKLIFYDGSGKRAELFDAPVAVKGGPPRAPVTVSADTRSNGGVISIDLRDGTHPLQTSQNAFLSDGKQKAFIFHAAFVGKGDIRSAGTSGMLASSTTPEFYSYTVDKPYLGADDERTPVTVPIRSVNIDHGDTPENERMTVTVDNSLGQVADFEERPNIPCRLYDDETGIVFFVGTVFDVTATEDEADEAPCVVFEARGMADVLLRSYASQLDFTQDGMNAGVAWHWQDALIECFEFGGFDRNSKVRFEDVKGQPGSRWNFPLWSEGDKGGAQKSGGTSDPHVVDQRWRPNPAVPIYQFMEYLLIEVMGWHWLWDRKNDRWSTFKRPRPGDTTDIPPKVRFYKNQSALALAPDDGTPAYKHRNIQKKTERPQCTTLVVYTISDDYGLDKATLAEQYGRDLSEEDALKPIMARGLRLKSATWENPRGFSSPDHPNADPTHPDWLGGRVQREASALQSASDEAFKFLGQRAFEDLAHGYVYRTILAPWGDDEATAYLKKWDPVEVDGVRHWFIKAAPFWVHDNVRQARYTLAKERDDVPPPR